MTSRFRLLRCLVLFALWGVGGGFLAGVGAPLAAADAPETAGPPEPVAPGTEVEVLDRGPEPPSLARFFALPETFYTSLDEDPAPSRPGWLGVTLQETEPVTPPGSKEPVAALRVTRVFPESPAMAEGIEAGDLIVGVQGKRLTRGEEPSLTLAFRKLVAAAGVGRFLPMELLRQGASILARPVLAGKPAATVRLKPHPELIPSSPWPKPTLFQFALESQKKMEDFAALHRELRARADAVVSTAVRGKTYNPFRLSEISYLLHHPLHVPSVGRRWVDRLDAAFTKEEAALSAEVPSLPSLFGTGRDALDLTPAQPPVAAADEPMGWAEYLGRLTLGLGAVETARQRAAGDLTPEERARLEKWVLTWVTDQQSDAEPAEAAILEDEARTLDFLQLAQRVDLNPLIEAAENLARLLNLPALRRLAAAGGLPDAFPPDWEVTRLPGKIRARTPAGTVILGGFEANVHTEEAVLILDVGGDDIYLAPSGNTGLDRPVSVILDLAGRDRYLSFAPFTQGSAFLGVGMLVDLEGEDVYIAGPLSQGAGVFGVGVLMDLEGRDTYRCGTFCQGGGLFGMGFLVDIRGSDHFAADLFAQGVGFVRGFGTLLDRAGHDTYFAGGLVDDHREPGRATQSLAQGFGYGLRPWDSLAGTSGGIGILADTAGNDTYQADYFAQGSSYWLGLGVLADRAGHDTYVAGRYSQGAGIHLGAGLLLDEAGDDQYWTHFGVSQGCGHDFGVGFLVDLGGSDRYVGGVLVQGAGNLNGIGVLGDTSGDEYYSAGDRSQGWGHWDAYRKLGSFGFLFDTGGGEDIYVPPASNGRLTLHGPWGVLADTP